MRDNREILDQYKSGKTLAEIAKLLKVTRARAQQIVIRELGNDILDSLNINHKLSSLEKEMLKVATHEEIKQITINRGIRKIQAKKDKISLKIKENNALQDLSNFHTLSSYASALGTDSLTLSKFFPEIVNEIKRQKNLRWSSVYEKCRSCETTFVPHRNKGFCEDCYPKSDHFKQMAKASFLKHIDARKKKSREYQEKYQARPEVRERVRQQNDKINFGGNREAALERDNFKCTKCGITQKDSYNEYNKDLYVEHKEGKNNDLGNLITVCKTCHNKKVLKIARESIGETLLQKYARLYKKS